MRHAINKHNRCCESIIQLMTEYPRYEESAVPELAAPWPRVTSSVLISAHPDEGTVDWDAITWRQLQMPLPQLFTLLCRVRAEWEHPLCPGLINTVEYHVSKLWDSMCSWTAEVCTLAPVLAKYFDPVGVPASWDRNLEPGPQDD